MRPKSPKLPEDYTDRAPDSYEPLNFWEQGEEELMGCNEFGCAGDCDCYDNGFDNGFSEGQQQIEESNADDIAITLFSASKEIEKRFRDRIHELEGDEIFHGDKLAGSEAERLKSLWASIKPIFE